jgi:hypothetical protein
MFQRSKTRKVHLGRVNARCRSPEVFCQMWGQTYCFVSQAVYVSAQQTQEFSPEMLECMVQVSRGLLPDVGSEYEGAGGDITDAVDFLLVNFTEMNKLWVRMQHQGSNRDKYVTPLNFLLHGRTPYGHGCMYLLLSDVSCVSLQCESYRICKHLALDSAVPACMDQEHRNFMPCTKSAQCIV